MFTSDYERRLAECLEKQDRIKHDIEFLRGQIKQEAKQKRWCKGSTDIKALAKLFSFTDCHIDNGAGLTYFGVKLSCLDVTPALPEGWIEFERRSIHENIGSPILRKFRKPGVPAHLYIEKAVR